MAGANKKVSDAWNTALAGYKCDRFSHCLGACPPLEEANKKGQSYQVFKASMVGYADEKLNAEARATYFAMQGMTDPTIH